MEEVTVISLGGSIIVPDSVDVVFLKGFSRAIREYLEEDGHKRLVLVTGGGAPARLYQRAYRDIVEDISGYQQDMIGIAATRLNAQLIYGVLEDLCSPDIVTDPTARFTFSNRILVAAGWKPGFSTDNDAVVLAERFGAQRVLNLSNIPKVYSADPKVDPSAVALDHIGWKDFRAMVGERWEPGKNVPFDPVAAKRASEIPLEVIASDGRDIENTIRILKHREYVGTTIGPEW